jgi:hypothetical protein
MPIPTTNWGFLSLVAMLAYMILTQRYNNKNTQEKIDDVSVKTDGVHRMLNSELDAFKKEAAEQYKVALENGIALVKVTADKLMGEKMAVLESKIAALESKLDIAREKVALAASKPSPQTGEERLGEIRGSEKM